MKDSYGREIDYLRVSVTDRCNLRCMYCMPPDGVRKLAHDDILSFEEIAEIAGAAVRLGIRKIRLTGGEPLLRQGIIDLTGMLSALPGLEELTLTTNGLLLPRMARGLKAAGVSRVNISLDTLDPTKYVRITRGGNLTEALSGIRAAEEAGLTPVKLNTVLIGGFNDDEIPAFAELTRARPLEVRFIELMPMVPGCFTPEAYIGGQTVLDRLPELIALESRDGIGEMFRLPGCKGRIGLIRPVTRPFCDFCSRLRLTSDGKLKTCLHTNDEYPLRGLHGTCLTDALASAIAQKPKVRGEFRTDAIPRRVRNMNQIGG